MTIDEAIAREREKAKEIRENIIDEKNLEPYESYCIAMAAKCAEEHEQLAEWLEELKAYRTLDKTKFLDGYNKALNDLDAILVDELEKSKNPYERWTINHILEVVHDKLWKG